MSASKPSAAAVKKALRACERDVMKLDGVSGVALTEVGGRSHVVVYVDRDTKALRERIPAAYDGVPVKIEVSGTFEAQ